MRKTGKNNIRNIQKTRSTYYVTMPIDIIKELKWKERQKVVVEKYGKNKIIISDWKK
ncbi:MAG: hypothetical protein JW740_01295 [Candidatus Zambryskibacteria bacterium]|nr:hypothetical protein [Candidatus Zambryskibacteria bacterium]